MEILINGNSVDFKLDNEKKFSELCDSIEKWASSRGLIMCSASADGKPYDADCDLDIESVKKADFTIQSKSDLIVDTLNEASFYCDKILSSLNSKVKYSAEQMSNIADGSAWLADVLSRILNLLEMDPATVIYNSKSAMDYVEKLKFLSLSLKENNASDTIKQEINVFTEIKNLMRYLMSSDNMRKVIIKSIDSPETIIGFLTELRKEAKSKIDSLEEISSQFQSGKDSTASVLLQEFVDFLFRFSRLSCQIPPVFGIKPEEIEHNGKNLAVINEEINTVLNEIISVMENNDIISLSDILEYELKVQMESVPAMLEILSEKLNSK